MKENIRRSLFAVVVTSAMPLLLLGCPKKEVPVVYDAAPAPTPTPTPTITDLAPLEDDAGVDAADAYVKPHATGSGLSTNQLRAKQCCSALRTQGKNMGNSPEGMQIIQAATFCDQAALSLGPQAIGQSPELAPMRAMLQGKTIPPICQGL